MIAKSLAVLPLLALAAAGNVSAQGSAAAPAELTVVTKGVFTLKAGQSVDLTDRGLLLHFNRVNTGPDDRVDQVVYTVNGGGGGYYIGTRRDLKTEPATREFVKDLRTCVLDLVSAVAPKGATASATFRLMCQ